MSKKLEEMFEQFINGNKDKASELLKAYIIETSAAINHRMMNDEEIIEDVTRDMHDDLVDEIEDHKEEIAAEEMYGENEEPAAVVDADITVDQAHDDLVDDLTDVEDVIDIEDIEDELSTEVEDEEKHEEEHKDEEHHDVAELADKVEDLEDKIEDKVDHDEFAELEAQFKTLQAEEEVEHNMDMDGDGKIGDHNVVEESIELEEVDVDMKDTTGKNKSPVAKGTEVLELEGEAVAIKGKGHKGFEREDMKVDHVTDDTNTVKSTDAAIHKIMESTNRLTKRRK